jgi:hypothetical protein
MSDTCILSDVARVKRQTCSTGSRSNTANLIQEVLHVVAVASELALHGKYY